MEVISVLSQHLYRPQQQSWFFQGQAGLSEAEISATGVLATALVLEAIRSGKIMCDSAPGLVPRSFPLKDIAQIDYLANIDSCLTCFGWSESEIGTLGQDLAKDFND